MSEQNLSCKVFLLKTETMLQTGTPVRTILSSINTVDGHYYTGNYGIGLRINYDY